MKNGTRFYATVLALFFLGLLWSGLAAHDKFTWVLEVLPAVLAAAVLAATVRRFEFSKLVYVAVLLHTFILMWGGVTTYAENPLFNWLKEIFNLHRNYYDRLGHLAQGFVPALAVREVFIRRRTVKPGWQFFLVCCVVLAFSAAYEFFEWWVSLASGSKGDAFLGTQGDVWDTQWDMFLALVGSVISQLSLSRVHDRAIEQVEK